MIDPHEPYERHEEFDFGEEILDRYDSEIAMVDAEFGRILHKLDELKLADRTVVVMMSDHGEEFGEHLSKYHNTSLYEEQIRVPLMIRIPGIAHRVLASTSNLVDVMPTLTRLLGITDPHLRVGRDLWPAILGLSKQEGYAYAELHPHQQVFTGGREMMVHGGFKLIVDPTAGTEEVYDLVADPGEDRNILGHARETEAILRGLLEHVRSEVAMLGGSKGPSPKDIADARYVLEHQLVAFASKGASEKEALLGELTKRLVDPVFGLKRDQLALIEGSVKDKLVAFLAQAFDGKDAQLGVSSLLLANRLEEPRILPALQDMRAQHPRVREELLILRGILGDHSATPALKALMSEELVFDRHRVAMALLLQGASVDTVSVRAACQTLDPFIVARLIRGLGRSRAPELLDISELMFTHADWQFAPLRKALVKALELQPASERALRLLARLACDAEREVAGPARAAVLASMSGPDGEQVLAAGAAEAECDGALFHRHYHSAIQYMRKAVELYPGNCSLPALKLARLCQVYSDRPEDSAQILEKLAEGTPGGDAARIIANRLEWHASPSVLRETELSYEVTSARLAKQAWPDAMCLLRLTVRNRGKAAWLGHRYAGDLVFEPALVNASGEVVEIRPLWAAPVGLRDVGPGGTADILIPFRSPTESGRYEITVRARWLTPWGRIRPVEAATPWRTSFEVIDRW
jgi:hypothetical protein